MSLKEADMGEFARAAVTVGAEHAELEDQIAKEREAKRIILERIVELVSPALRAICTRVPVFGQTTSMTSDPSFVYATGRDARAVLIGVEGADPKTGLPHPISAGVLGGSSLFLSEEGNFFLLRYAGTISADKHVAWTSNFCPLTTAEVIEQKWSTAAIYERLADALDRYLRGKGSKRTSAVEENVEKLRAIGILVSGIERTWR